MLSAVLIPMLVMLANVITIAVIVQFILSILLSFNVVSIHNNIVSALWQSLNAILEPILAPIRRFMPDTGMLDLSPMVLLFLIQFVIRMLIYIGSVTA
jgi:YggT family protein